MLYKATNTTSATSFFITQCLVGLLAIKWEIGHKYIFGKKK